MNSVSVANLVEAINLTVYSGEEYLEEKQITTSDIYRPGLELTGYFEYYPEERIQLFGMTEVSYAHQLTKKDLQDVAEKLCAPKTPCLVIARDLKVPAELEKSAKANNIPILLSSLPTTRLSSKMTDYLEGKLAERRAMHGVLVDIYGLGVLITGDSGVGKSETALELIKRGHRLIADDRVEVWQQDEQTVVGEAPQILRHLFGAGAVWQDTDISLIVHLENWSKDKQFDRLGSGEQSQQIFDVSVPKITIPVKIGRNLAIIIEAAAMNFRAKTMGYDATKAFERNLNNLIKENSEN